MQLLISSRDKIAKKQHYVRAKVLCLCRTFAVYGHKVAKHKLKRENIVFKTVYFVSIEVIFYRENMLSLRLTRRIFINSQ